MRESSATTSTAQLALPFLFSRENPRSFSPAPAKALQIHTGRQAAKSLPVATKTREGKE
jgi:hypothetical protein